MGTIKIYIIKQVKETGVGKRTGYGTMTFRRTRKK
jgi:hypothetical protein